MVLFSIIYRSCQFVDLHLEKRESLFPEGLAGNRQGELAYVLGRDTTERLEDSTNTFRARDESSGSSLTVMRREATDAIIEAMEAFVAGGEWGETWLEHNQGSTTKDSTDVGNNESNDPSSENGTIQKSGERSTAAGEEVEAMNEGIDVSSMATSEKNMKKEIRTASGTPYGPKWEEAAKLAELGRKPLATPRRVRVQPSQVRGSNMSIAIARHHIEKDAECLTEVVVRSSCGCRALFALYDALHCALP